MSLRITTDCQPSAILNAAASTTYTIPSDVWSELDDHKIFMCECQAMGHPWNDAAKYRSLLQELENLMRVQFVMASAEKNRATERAREYVDLEIALCQNQLEVIEKRVTPKKIEQYFAERLTQVHDDSINACGTVIPHEGIEIRTPAGMVVRVLFAGDENGVRGASYDQTLAFLQALPAEVWCAVSREGVDKVKEALASGHPSECLAYLSSGDGHDLACKVLPPYDENGNPIPA